MTLWMIWLKKERMHFVNRMAVHLDVTAWRRRRKEIAAWTENINGNRKISIIRSFLRPRPSSFSMHHKHSLRSCWIDLCWVQPLLSMLPEEIWDNLNAKAAEAAGVVKGGLTEDFWFVVVGLPLPFFLEFKKSFFYFHSLWSADLYKTYIPDCSLSWFLCWSLSVILINHVKFVAIVNFCGTPSLEIIILVAKNFSSVTRRLGGVLTWLISDFNSKIWVVRAIICTRLLISNFQLPDATRLV